MLIRHKSSRQVQTCFKPKLRHFFFFFAKYISQYYQSWLITDKIYFEKPATVTSHSGISNSYVQYYQDQFIYKNNEEKSGKIFKNRLTIQLSTKLGRKEETFLKSQGHYQKITKPVIIILH